MSTVIAAVTHEKHNMPGDELYLPLMAGAFGMSVRETADYVRDDYGDNISERNAGYCELTGLYWMWKNCDADNIGLCHYRRYFAEPERFLARMSRGARGAGGIFVRLSHAIAKRAPGADRYEYILTGYSAEHLMEQHEIVLPKPRNYLIETNYSQYAHAHDAAHLDIAREVISDEYPEYLDAYDARMAMSTGHRFNMFIMRRELLDEYCRWLFDILFELERRIGDSGSARVYGYIGERLLDVWIDKNGYEYTELPYVFIGKEHLLRKAALMIVRKLKNKLS